jgi:hypothetical protein
VNVETYSLIVSMMVTVSTKMGMTVMVMVKERGTVGEIEIARVVTMMVMITTTKAIPMMIATTMALMVMSMVMVRATIIVAMTMAMVMMVMTMTVMTVVVMMSVMEAVRKEAETAAAMTDGYSTV